MKKHKTPIFRGLSALFAMLLTLSVGAAFIMEANRGEIDGFFNTHSSVVVTTDDGTLFSAYTPDEAYLNAGKGNSSAIVKAHVDMNTQMSEEGSVLLKNNGALPLAKSSKVTLLGIRSSVILAGSGMGVSAKANQVVQLETALSEKYSVNPTMSAAYKKVNETHKLKNNDRAAASKFNPKEASLTELEAASPAYADSFAEYSDAAIVVVGRPSSEMGDYAPGAAGVDPASGASTAMELTTDEKAVIELAKSKFNKVIVLVNTNSPMEIDGLKNDDKISAILWVGHPGCYGVYGIANILTGEANPSGHLYDLYAADSLSSPAMQNMGDFAYANPTSDFTRSPSNGSNNKYLIEAENIYTGYRYYETRYEDVVLNRGNASSVEKGAFASTDKWSYAKEVSYPFGYGLSYTSFTQKIDSVKIKQEPHSITATIKVTVKNTGDKAGMDVVQIYGQAPYVKGGIEKSAVQLLSYDKTGVIEAGKEQTLTLEVDFQNIASWDSTALNGTGSYVLDNGNYYFTIGNGSHEAINNILAKKGKTKADGMDAEGDADKAYVWTYNYSGGKVDVTTYNVTKAKTKVGNALSTADWNTYKKGEVVYLSRNDWTGTWPKTYTGMTLNNEMLDIVNGKIYEVKQSEEKDIPTYGQKGDRTFAEMKGAAFDDTRWDELLNQLDLQEALNCILSGNRTWSAMPSVGFLNGRYTENGPNGIGGRGFSSLSYNNFGDTVPEWMISETDENATFGMNIFPSAPVVASTFNPRIAYEQGRLIGNDALFVGLPILWGPGMNTHRHPYNGRSGEYYSEDPILTGVCGMEFAIGALDKGLIAAPKHYAFNDQEANRTGVAPYMTEQKAREVELRAFQIAFEADKYDKLRGKDIGMMGVMTSFSKIGPYEVTCSSGMLKDILRSEWGFNGYIVSDMNDDTDLFTAAIAAGLSSFDASGTTDKLKKNPFTADDIKGDATLVSVIKESIHYNLYVLANSNYMNGVSINSHVENRITSWRVGYIVAISVSAVLLVGMVALSVVFAKKEELL